MKCIAGLRFARMRPLLACLALVLGLAGCASPTPPDAGPVPLESSAPGAAQGTQPDAPAPSESGGGGTTSHAVVSHREGSVGVSLLLATPSNECDIGAFAHHATRWHNGPPVSWSLYGVTADGSLQYLLGFGSVPVPTTRADAGPAEGSTLTTLAYGTVFGVYWDALGFDATFTSGTWASDVALDAGTYLLEAFTEIALDGGKEATEGGSLLAGVDCDDGFDVLSARETAGAFVATSASVDGTLDLTTEAGVVELHEGAATLDFRGSDCRARFSSIQTGGTVRVADEEVAVDAAENLPAAGGTWLRFHREFALAAPLELGWTLYGAGWSGWELTASCFAEVPAGQAWDGWSLPG